LELHNHYEKLLPPASSTKTAAEFVPVPYFKDFLVIQPYKSKSIFPVDPVNLESKRTTPRTQRGAATAMGLPASARGLEYANTFFHYRDLRSQANGRNMNSNLSSKQSMRAAMPPRTPTTRPPDVPRVDMEFDHMFLIDKRIQFIQFNLLFEFIGNLYKFSVYWL
jgi:hypothetical protein